LIGAPKNAGVPKIKFDGLPEPVDLKLDLETRVHYNTIRTHSALGYRPPAPEIIVPGRELPMNHEAA